MAQEPADTLRQLLDELVDALQQEPDATTPEARHAALERGVTVAIEAVPVVRARLEGPLSEMLRPGAEGDGHVDVAALRQNPIAMGELVLQTEAVMHQAGSGEAASQLVSTQAHEAALSEPPERCDPRTAEILLQRVDRYLRTDARREIGANIAPQDYEADSVRRLKAHLWALAQVIGGVLLWPLAAAGANGQVRWGDDVVQELAAEAAHRLVHVGLHMASPVQ